MKTIEERADRAIYEPTDGHPLKACEVVAFARGYELGAIEQKDIDDAELLKLKSSWEKEAQINHDDEANYKQGYHDAIDKACKWITEHIDMPYEGEFVDNSSLALGYFEWCEKRLEYAKEITNEFRKAMEK